MIEKIKDANISFEGKVWKTISKDAKSLIKKLLKRDEFLRYTSSEALLHPWISNVYSIQSTLINSTPLLFYQVGEVSNEKIDVSKSQQFRKFCRASQQSEDLGDPEDDDLSLPNKTVSQPLYIGTQTGVIRSKKHMTEWQDVIPRATSSYISMKIERKNSNKNDEHKGSCDKIEEMGDLEESPKKIK